MSARWLMLLLTFSCTTTQDLLNVEFVVSDADFLGYESWEHFDLPATSLGAPHTSAARRVYLNRRPAPGALVFPDGTIIVKAQKDGTGDVLAMVKRGGDYNGEWARGWEWMEIVKEDGAPHIEWRGFEPPEGASYSEAGVSCNLCHQVAKKNDWVHSAALKLPMQ